MNTELKKWYDEKPLNWNLIKLKYIANLRDEKISEESTLPYIGLEDIVSKKGELSKPVSAHEYVSGISNVFYPGDVLFGKLRPYLAKVCTIDFKGKCTSELLVLNSINEKVNDKYLKYLMISKKFIDEVNSSTYGTKMPRANWGFIGNIGVPLPGKLTQKNIASFLDQKTSEIDALISDKEKLIKLLEEKRQAVITEVVTKGLNPDVKMKDSGVEWIGEIPEHWGIVKLKSKGEIRGRIGYRGYTTEDLVEEGKGAITLGASNINKLNQLDLSQKSFISWKKYYESPEIMVQTSDLIFVQRGSVGRFCIIEDEVENITINPSLLIIKGYIENPKHLYWYLNSNYITNLVILLTTSTAVPMVSQEQLKNFTIVLPSIQEQNEITEYLNHKTRDYDDTVNIVNGQINKLKEYRQALIYEAVTGKIDVQEMVKEIEQEEVSSS